MVEVEYFNDAEDAPRVYHIFNECPNDKNIKPEHRIETTVHPGMKMCDKCWQANCFYDNYGPDNL